MQDHPVLGQVALGYSPMIDRQRAVVATRLTVFPERPGAEPDAAAHELFAVLHELDAAGAQAIWVEAPPADPAVPQRVLHRAAATAPARIPGQDDAAQQQLDRGRQEYVKLLQTEHRLPSFSAAWALASQLRPELFNS
jgi:EAL and modified HD-GYP domain-containing signal transduction protein